MGNVEDAKWNFIDELRRKEETNNLNLIGFSGYGRSGKDLAAEFLAEFGYRRLAFADKMREALYLLNPVIKEGPPGQGLAAVPFRLKEIVDMFGWDKAKTQYEEVRELLQRFGTEVGRELFGEDFWVDLVMNQIEGPDDKVVITDVRFDNEVAAIHSRGGRVYRIHRDGTGPVNTHLSDNQVLQVDVVIPNVSTKERFRKLVLAMTGVDYPRAGGSATNSDHAA